MGANKAIVIDGSYGEGGGQIVRSALSLSMATGRPCRLIKVRANRSKPGLGHQHLTAVRASAKISAARVGGAELGATEFSFTPGPVRSGGYQFDVGTAGAATLVLQTVLPALARAEGESRLLITGGTHVPWSPPFHYLEQVFCPILRLLGFPCRVAIGRWGFYPKGGGEIEAVIASGGPAADVTLDEPFRLERLTGVSASSRLPDHVRVRQARQLEARLRRAGMAVEMTVEEVAALSPGSFAFVHGEGRSLAAGFSSLGERGKPAEQVADEAADALLQFLASKAALDPHLADQILIYLAMISGSHRFTVSEVTEHLLTNAWVTEQFLPVHFEVTGGLHKPGLITKRDRG
jgi:RNA 3'-terminal phosphate cyclase (ATP)